MDRIRDADISVTRHPTDGFTLLWESDSGEPFHRRYIGYSVRDAKRRFKDWLREEDDKVCYATTREDVLLDALQGICGGNREAARRLLGNS
jgi:predicted SPOUT superfamily RNA methylase MTH1